MIRRSTTGIGYNRKPERYFDRLRLFNWNVGAQISTTVLTGGLVPGMIVLAVIFMPASDLVLCRLLFFLVQFFFFFLGRMNLPWFLMLIFGSLSHGSLRMGVRYSRRIRRRPETTIRLPHHKQCTAAHIGISTDKTCYRSRRMSFHRNAGLDGKQVTPRISETGDPATTSRTTEERRRTPLGCRFGATPRTAAQAPADCNSSLAPRHIREPEEMPALLAFPRPRQRRAN